jgi:hypothetical protein
VSDADRDDRPEQWLEPDAEAALAEALRAAFAPVELDPARHAEILTAALEDPFAPPTEDELRESERLRHALETGDDTHAGAALARALSAAVRPEPLPRASAERVAARAVRRRTNVVFVAFGGAALAAAAALALLLAQPRTKQATMATAAPAAGLARSRSTAELFSERFEPGQTTARIDRIASSREREWRDNQYALWGVR